MKGRKPKRKTPTARWEKVGKDLWMINIYSYDHHELNKAKNVFHYVDNKLNNNNYKKSIK